MTPARAVQFRTPGDVLQAYESRGVPAYSICCGKQFMFKYEGADLGEGKALLEQILSTLTQSAGIYTLAVYEDPDEDQAPKAKTRPGKARVRRINNETPYDGSFNFRFAEYNDLYGMIPAPGGRGGVMAGPAGGQLSEVVALLKESNKRLEDMETRIKDLEEDPGDEGDGGDMIGKISTLLDNPVIAGFLSQLLAPPAKQGATINGIPGISDERTTSRIEKALAVLLKADPDLAEHLEKLARLAETKPIKFKLLLNSLAYV